MVKGALLNSELNMRLKKSNFQREKTVMNRLLTDKSAKQR